MPDRMATTTNLWAVGMATLLNSGIVALVILLGMRAVNHTPPFLDPVNKFVIKEFPLLATLKPHASDGSSGGGANDSVEVNKGCNPKRDMNPLAPVQVPSLENPKLSIENKIAVSPDLKLPDSPEIVVIGIHSSANVTLMSGGAGSKAGIGSENEGGDGPGHGQKGWGSGSGQGIYVPGLNGVTHRFRSSLRKRNSVMRRGGRSIRARARFLWSSMRRGTHRMREWCSRLGWGWMRRHWRR